MRMSVSAAVAALIMVLAAPAGAQAAAAVFVELNPSTVPAGDDLSLRASCDDNLEPATVTAEPFGSITVQPEFGFLTAAATVPEATEAGDYPVTLRCPDDKTATATLHVVAKVQPDRGPATGGGGTASGVTPPVLIGAGLAVMAAGGVLGGLALLRRRHG